MGGRERALSLLNTCARSWYLGGMQDRPGEKGRDGVTSTFSLRSDEQTEDRFENNDFPN